MKRSPVWPHDVDRRWRIHPLRRQHFRALSYIMHAVLASLQLQALSLSMLCVFFGLLSKIGIVTIIDPWFWFRYTNVRITIVQVQLFFSPAGH